MKRNYIPAFIMLLAGFITCVLGLYYRYDAIRLSVTLFVVLVCFYVLGCFVKGLVCHFIPENQEEEAQTDGNESENEEKEITEGEEEEKEE